MKNNESIKQEAISMWADGKSLSNISKILGVSHSCLSRWTKNLEPLGKRKIKEEKKHKAVELRKKGYSALEISVELGIPKGTIGHWIESVEISTEHKERLKEKKLLCSSIGCRRGSKINKQNSDARHEKAFADGIERSKNDKLFNIICALYWGEGAKTRRCFIMTNSDPLMIKLVTSWLTLEGHKYKVQLNHHSDGTSEEVIWNFWIPYLIGFDFKNMYKIQWKKSKGNCNRKMQMGCMHIVVQQAAFHSFVMGGIEGLKSLAIGPDYCEKIDPITSNLTLY